MQLQNFLQLAAGGSLRLSAQSPQAAHSFDPLMMNATHHVDALLFVPPLAPRSDAIEWSTQLRTHSLGAMSDPGEKRLRSTTFVMHEQATTLKHYLKVVPFRYEFVDGETQRTYLYKANYNEYKPRKLEWYEGFADAYVDTDLVPNAAFHFDISPVMVVMNEETQSFSSFVTKICAVIGGIYTVVGLLDSVLRQVLRQRSECSPRVGGDGLDLRELRRNLGHGPVDAHGDALVDLLVEGGRNLADVQ